MKFKTIPDEYFITILDRLTRFEPAYVRYERVFNNIISKYVIGANYKKLSIIDKIDLVEQALYNTLNICTNDFISNIILKLEDKYFYKNELSYQYLSARLNFTSMLKRIELKKNLPLNVYWLKNISCDTDLNTQRINKSLLYPIEKIILCEGETEHILLDTLLKLFNIDIKKLGYLLIPAGGKNQVAKKYYSMIEYTKLPFFILLDRDAIAVKRMIEPKLRSQDRIYVINSGEFEDLIPIQILESSINFLHKNDIHCLKDDFNDTLPMAQNLENIYKKYGFGDFKKAHFAHSLNDFIEQYAKKEDFVNSEIVYIAQQLVSVIKTQI